MYIIEILLNEEFWLAISKSCVTNAEFPFSTMQTPIKLKFDIKIKDPFSKKILGLNNDVFVTEYRPTPESTKDGV